MPGLDKFGRPVGYGDGRSPSLADKVRLLQQLVKERQKLGGERDRLRGVAGNAVKKKPPVAGINPPNRGRPVNAPMRPPLPGGGLVDPGFLMDNRPKIKPPGGGGGGFNGHPPDRNGNGGRPVGVGPRPTGMPLSDWRRKPNPLRLPNSWRFR